MTIKQEDRRELADAARRSVDSIAQGHLNTSLTGCGVKLSTSDVLVQRFRKSIEGLREYANKAGATCTHCGYWNRHDTNVRDVEDGRMFCNNCGEMFDERN